MDLCVGERLGVGGVLGVRGGGLGLLGAVCCGARWRLGRARPRAVRSAPLAGLDQPGGRACGGSPVGRAGHVGELVDGAAFGRRGRALWSPGAVGVWRVVWSSRCGGPYVGRAARAGLAGRVAAPVAWRGLIKGNNEQLQAPADTGRVRSDWARSSRGVSRIG